MLCGDETAGIVCDIGSYQTKFGYSGEDAPKHVFRSSSGLSASLENSTVPGTRKRKKPSCSEPLDENLESWYTGDQSLSIHRENVLVSSPLTDGLLTDWDMVENLWDHGYELMRAESHDWPVMCSESSWSTRTQRLQYMELMLEKYRAPAMHIAKSGTLAAYSAGRATALICEISHSGINITPVVEGHILNKSVRRNSLGGQYLSQEIIRMLKSQNIEIPLKKSKIPLSKLHPTYVAYWREDIALDMLKSCTRVSQTTGNNRGSLQIDSSSVEIDDRESQNDLNVSNSYYELPDRTQVCIKAEIQSVPDNMFDTKSIPMNVPSISELCIASLASCDGDARKDLVGNVVLSGGVSCLNGVPERLGDELSTLLPKAFKLRVLTPSPLERRFAVWIGGSILSCLGTFQQMWLSKEEYDELGAQRAEERFMG